MLFGLAAFIPFNRLPPLREGGCERIWRNCTGFAAWIWAVFVGFHPAFVGGVIIIDRILFGRLSKGSVWIFFPIILN